MTEIESKIVPIEKLREFCIRVFLHCGVPKDDARQAAEVLACADLRGIDSHGVARMYSYFGMLSEGHINPKPQIKTLRSTPSTATVDGDNGLGLVVGVAIALIAGLSPIGKVAQLVNLGTLAAFFMVCASVIILRKTQPDAPRPFRTPGVPYVPVIGALICLAQMVGLPVATWERLLIWLAIGLAVYFSYSRRASTN